MRNPANVIKMMRKTDNGFFSPERILSYGRPANIIIGHRSGGKSTGVARFVLFDAILNSRRFIYIRRRKDELDKTKKKFFDQAIDIINSSDLGFKIIYFDCVAGNYMMTVLKDGEEIVDDLYDDEGQKIDETEEERAERVSRETLKKAVKVGSTVALSESQKVKSGFDFSNTDSIIFDEFIAEHQTQYLGSSDTPDVEYENLISLFMSCDRGVGQYFRNETRIFLIGNMANMYNPILLKWGVNKYLRMSQGAKFIAPKGMGWVVQEVKPSDKFIEAAKNSNALLLMDETERNYNLGNEARSEEYSDAFIRSKVPNNSKYRSGVVLDGVEYGIYQDKDGFIYINKFRNNEPAEALDIVSYANGNANILVTNWRQSPILNVVYIAFLRKKLYFNNATTQHNFMQYLEFIPR